MSNANVNIDAVESERKLSDRITDLEQSEKKLREALLKVRDKFAFYQCGGSNYAKDADEGVLIIDEALAAAAEAGVVV